MTDDSTLLRRFAEGNDHAAFAMIVERHLGFVYAVCVRRLRDGHAARDATQTVFIALARKARQVAAGPTLIGWLHRSACYEASNAARGAARRAEREKEAQRRLAIDESMTGSDTHTLATVLDEALQDISEADRNLVLLRFFEDKSYAEIAAACRATENTARMRVERALDRLRVQLDRRGYASTAALLATTLPAYANVAVPPALAGQVAAAACAAGSATSVASLLIAMSHTKVLATAVVIAALGGFFYEHHRTSQLEETLGAERRDRAAADMKLNALRHEVATLRETIVSAPGHSESQASPTSAPVTSVEAPPPGVTVAAAPGWHKNGSKPEAYTVGTDSLNAWGGMPSAYVKSNGPVTDAFGGMMQTVSADDFAGKRVRLTAWMKTENANAGANLWMRVDGKANEVLAFDNMSNRQPKGTTDWNQYSVVLDVPPSSARVNYGFFLSGAGKAWVNGVTIEPVGADVATTDMQPTAKITLPRQPVNLGFGNATTP